MQWKRRPTRRSASRAKIRRKKRSHALHSQRRLALTVSAFALRKGVHSTRGVASFERRKPRFLHRVLAITRRAESKFEAEFVRNGTIGQHAFHLPRADA